MEPDLSTSPAWTDYTEALRGSVNAWLARGCAGPMHEIISLQDGTVPLYREPGAALPPPSERRYRVKFNAVQEWSRGASTVVDVYPGTTETRYSSLAEANAAVVQVLYQVLGDELEAEEEDVRMGAIDELRTVGDLTSRAAMQLDVVKDRHGHASARALYVEAAMDDVKVTAWVECDSSLR
ncbi:hypothetical protein LTR85_002681 [Meristemomyces frigidus]|nr:hypothetical protein LTR85_002681 [Meristemomyces frigidus]